MLLHIYFAFKKGLSVAYLEVYCMFKNANAYLDLGVTTPKKDPFLDHFGPNMNRQRVTNISATTILVAVLQSPIHGYSRYSIPSVQRNHVLFQLYSVETC